jgi:hypothetical protein
MNVMIRVHIITLDKGNDRLTWLAIMAHARRAPCSDDAAPPPADDDDPDDDDDPAVEELEGDTTKRRKLLRWGMARCL